MNGKIKLYGGSLNTKTIVHSTLMVFAWIMFSPIGSLIARYLKVEMVSSWFHMHRTMQVSS
jgi:hypothetical protein